MTQEEDPVKPIGVGLKRSEAQRLTEIANDIGVPRHALLIWIIRDFVHRWESGYRPPTKLRRVLKDPGEE